MNTRHVVVVVLFFLTPFQHAIANAQADTRKAELLLSSYSGQRAVLSEAHSILQHVIQANPDFSPAYVQLARHRLKAGHISYRNYAEGTLQAAIEFLDKAIGLDNKNANAYVLLGHVLTIIRAYDEARRTLEQAEQIGTDNPWLHMNWADLLETTGDHKGAVSRYHIVAKQMPDDSTALAAAYKGLAEHYTKTEDFGKKFTTTTKRGSTCSQIELGTTETTPSFYSMSSAMLTPLLSTT